MNDPNSCRKGRLVTSLVFITCASLAGCAAVSIYDQTHYIYDEVTQREYVELGFRTRLLGVGLCDSGSAGLLAIPQCEIERYRLYQDGDNVLLSFESVDDIWAYYDTAAAEGKQLRTSDPVRGISDGNVSESMTITVPLDEFAKWSCRENRVIVRVSGEYYKDIALDVQKIRQFLAKANDFLDMDLQDACFSYSSID